MGAHVCDLPNFKSGTESDSSSSSHDGQPDQLQENIRAFFVWAREWYDAGGPDTTALYSVPREETVQQKTPTIEIMND